MYLKMIHLREKANLFFLNIRRYINSKLFKKNFSIIANNCVGGVIYHDLGLQYKSPTINLWINYEDFFKYVENIEQYNNCPMTQVYNINEKYPIGELGDDTMDKIRIHFQHYSTFEQAVDKWEERKERINYNNICVVLEGIISEDIYDKFKAVKYPHKLLITYKESDIKISDKDCKKCVRVISSKKVHPFTGDLFKFSGWFGKRYLNKSGYRRFLIQCLKS